MSQCNAASQLKYLSTVTQNFKNTDNWVIRWKTETFYFIHEQKYASFLSRKLEK